MHLSGSLKNIVEFSGFQQHMGECGLTGRDDGMGNTAFKILCPRHLIGMQQLAEKGAVKDTFMGAVSDIADDHGVFTGYRVDNYG
jgi:hypothetical protein